MIKSLRNNCVGLGLIFGLIVGCSFSTIAQELKENFYQGTHYTTDDGLLSTTLFEITEDKRGCLWIGSNNGISKFDGSVFTNYTHFTKDGESIKMGSVLSICFDNQGERIYIGTIKGIFTASIYKTEFIKIGDYLPGIEAPDLHIHDMILMENGQLWAASHSDGLIQIDLEKKSVRHETLSHKAISENAQIKFLKAIQHDPLLDDIIWIAGFGGLVRLNSKTWNYEVYIKGDDPLNPINQFEKVFVDSVNVYLGTSELGLIVFNKSTRQFKETLDKGKYEQSYIRVSNISKWNDNYLWVTNHSGIMEYNIRTGEIENIYKNDIKSMSVYGVSYIDSRGILWYNLPKKGLFKFDPITLHQRYIPLTERNVLEKPMEVRKIIQHNGFTYILGLRSSGIYKMNPDDMTFEFIPIEGKRGYNLRDMVLMPDGNFLMASYRDLFVLNTTTEVIELISTQIDHPNPGLNTLVKDNQNNYWVGTNQAGLIELNFNNNSSTYFTDEFNQFRDKNYMWIKRLYMDTKENLWIGKGSTTLMSLKDRSIKCLNKADTTIGMYGIVVAYEEDALNRVWMSSYGEGLGYANVDSFEFGVNHKLDGNFTGLRMMNDSIMLTVDQEGLGKFNIQNYSFERLGSYEHANRWIRIGPIAIHETSKNNFMIGCRNGVVVYNSTRDPYNYEVPQPYIYSISRNGEEIIQPNLILDNKLTFASNTTYLNIKLSAIGFHYPKQITYKYQFENNDWRIINSAEKINLDNLKYGQYDFKIVACNNQGVCNEQPIKYILSIQPAWYQTWWAWLLYFLVAILILYLLSKERNRKRILDQQLKREQAEADRLKELDIFKTRFYANITHEFRTPLTVIQGMADEHEVDSNEESKIKVNLIKKHSYNLLSLVNQMLNLAKLRAGKLTVNNQQDDIIPFLKYLVEAHESFANSKSVGLQFYSDKESLFMDFDARKVEQVLTNLISNAIKFTPEYGKILVIAKAIDKEHRPHLQIVVQDNGIGIAEDEIPHIFDRFHQAKEEHQLNGTGIGLALVEELMRSMGAKISVESELNKGTKVILEFEVHKNMPLSKSSIKDISQPHDHSMVALVSEDIAGNEDLPYLLIIEDNEDVIYYLKQCLQGTYRTKISRDGESGLGKAFETIPDIIISDIMMPKMDGFELCSRIKEDERTSHIPVVLLTARAAQGDKLTGLRKGADAYLTKPFEKEELLIRLEKLLEIRNKLRMKYSRKLVTTLPNELASPNIEDSFILKVEKIILDNLDNQDFSSEDLTSVLFLSRSQLHRKLKAITGMSIHIYIRYVRLQKAKELIENSTLSISEIAYTVGFKSPVYFSQAFKSSFDYSPSSLRKK